MRTSILFAALAAVLLPAIPAQAAPVGQRDWREYRQDRREYLRDRRTTIVPFGATGATMIATSGATVARITGISVVAR